MLSRRFLAPRFLLFLLCKYLCNVILVLLSSYYFQLTPPFTYEFDNIFIISMNFILEIYISRLLAREKLGARIFRTRREEKGKRSREREDREANERSHKLSLSGTRDEAFRPMGLAAIFDKAIRRTRKFSGTARIEPNRPRLSRYQLATISRRHGDLILEIYLPDKLKVFSPDPPPRNARDSLAASQFVAVVCRNIFFRKFPPSSSLLFPSLP